MIYFERNLMKQMYQKKPTDGNLFVTVFPVSFRGMNYRYLVSNWGDVAIVQIDSNDLQSYFNTDYLNQYPMVE